MAARMTWEGTSRKERRDKLPEAGKFAAAVRAAAMSNGLAVSLNIGIRREAMLLEHGDPKRRMTQALSKHLSPAGFGDLPYALLFEVAPERDFRTSTVIPCFWFFGCRRFSNFNGLWGGLRRFSGSLVVTRFSNYALEPLAFGDVSFVHVHAHH
ncbi:hypothetical protein ACFP8Z_02645 [Gemmobacter lanyuensis]|uniref:hypothetical protein n=1 Tax=Gemmobacter lanyuensis TaxID=1054497 RepID=UPI00360B419A